MKKFLKKVLKNKKEIFTIALFFFLSFSIPLTGYFVTSDRSFDERSEASTQTCSRLEGITYVNYPSGTYKCGDILVNNLFRCVDGKWSLVVSCGNFYPAMKCTHESSGYKQGYCVDGAGNTCEASHKLYAKKCFSVGIGSTVTWHTRECFRDSSWVNPVVCPGDCKNGICSTTSSTQKYRRTTTCGSDSKWQCIEDANGSFSSLTECRGYCTPSSATPPSSSTAVKITSFTISPSTQVQGGSITLSGKMENATSCTFSDGTTTDSLPASDLNGFTKTATVTKSPGTYTYRLACTGGGGDAEKTATLTVNDATSPPPPSGGTCSSLGGTCSWTYIISGSRCTTGGKTGTVKMGLCPNDEGCCVPNTTTPPPPPPPSPTVKYSRSSNVCGSNGKYSCVENANGSYTALSDCQGSCTPPPPPPLGECTTNLDCRRQAPFEICFENSCLRGDVLNNSLVNMLDFSQFKKDFVIFKQSGWSEALRKSDFNLDGRISMADYSVFVRSYRLVNRLD